MSEYVAKYHLGQIVYHQRFDYRGVVYDVDPVFAGDDDWYDEVARSRPPKDQPWYHVMVSGGSQTTYVAERNLTADDSGAPITHPMIDRCFSGFQDGGYISRSPIN